jgi:RimJ/RimL family protein N-acetyltransferase
MSTPQARPRATSATLSLMFAPAWPVMTERLLLRPFEPADFDALYAIHADQANARYLYNEPRTRQQVEDLLERKRAGSALAAEGDWLSAAAVLPASGELVADVSLLWASELHGQGEIGFIVHPAHQRHGYATEAARSLLAFAFGTLGLHRVYGRLEPRNVGSARVLEKLGMRREAHLQERERVGQGRVAERADDALRAREWAEQRQAGETA